MHRHLPEQEDVFPVEPWCLRETALHEPLLPRSESLLALSNGHIGVRGNLDEGEPHGLPGTYLNSVYELRPLPYAEAGYGYPESGQSLIDVTNGKILRLLVDDEPFDVRYGDLISHERVLDFRAGTLTRTAEWRSPADRTVRLTTTRLVSFTHRSILAIEYVVEPVDAAARVVVQSELVANEVLPGPVHDDPRVSSALANPLRSIEHSAAGTSASLLHETKQSGLRVATAMSHLLDAPPGVDVDVRGESFPDLARVTFTAALEPGQRLRLVKLVSYGWSAERSVPALRDQVAAALTGAEQTGWDCLLSDQRSYLDDYWEGAEIELDGDPALQQAVRFALFHVLQSGARAERRPIPAKGLTGPGYDGHCFWDTEAFVLPPLTRTAPGAVADFLRWRYDTLPEARDRARQLRLAGAAFPWRTIDGAECSAYWPAGTAAFHINADIADAVVRYCDATGDVAFEREVGVALLVETARLWRSLGHYDETRGEFRIDGVTGPDEYTAVVDNNVYTNLMAQRNLVAAADVVARYPAEAESLEVTADEAESWRRCAAAVYIPYDDELGVHPQSEGFTKLKVWDFEQTDRDDYPLMLHFPYFDLYRKQVVKQADLVLALHRRGDAFTDEQKARNFAYYEALTVRDSSLSACTQAVMAAEVGHLDLAFAYTAEAAFTDLHDLKSNTGDGLHMASLAGVWVALVDGFGGLRDEAATLRFAPRLPQCLTRLAFTVRHRGHRVRVETDGRSATYSVASDGTETTEELEVFHHGEPVTLTPGEPVSLPVPQVQAPRAPQQPPGRRPLPRRVHDEPHGRPPARAAERGGRSWAALHPELAPREV
ncbi:glycoside hydrolase family 65 protein [Motilibacter aurantiacus]|uniref:glycoside hydrolase family 65 protein n=1 Tax=Motilibacter aurantiacus TaxID=2714955 RepID=UPI00140E32A0|nr:glycoside hydrolase family 65 protein [Motilibacter aurantiacus]NHC47447.1 glycoside hydrolase family 65 protein [Motilibacter aurantiacus]